MDSPEDVVRRDFVIASSIAATDPTLMDGWVDPSPDKKKPSASALAYFPLTALGNAERFRVLHRFNMKFCHTWNRWLIWDGKRWALDTVNQAMENAVATIRQLYTQAKALPEETDDASRRLI